MYPYPQMYQQQMPNNNAQSNNGFLIVRSEEEARKYPLAPGFSMTFFDETKPYCYKKTMSFSPLDHPTFDVYKIVKEESDTQPKATEESVPEWRNEIDNLQEEIDRLYKEIQALKAKPKPVTKRKEDIKDDPE